MVSVATLSDNNGSIKEYLITSLIRGVFGNDNRNFENVFSNNYNMLFTEKKLLYPIVITTERLSFCSCDYGFFYLRKQLREKMKKKSDAS